MSNTWRYEAATFGMPEFRRLEIGTTTVAFDICIRDGTPLHHPDIAGRTLSEIGRCKIHEGRSHWRVS